VDDSGRRRWGNFVALTLPIFEGVMPILELKVIARQLLGG
jgi:hypothetical protein